MVPQDTKMELLTLVERMTRELSSSNYSSFTTARIASECHVSRSLASQYLNDLVRTGQVVKVNERPVLFFHRGGLERYLQCPVSGCEYDSMRDLLSSTGVKSQRDFEKAIGSSLSCGPCVESLKSAVRYPPHGLPVLLVGEHGTGKQLMSELMFEFGQNEGLLPASARYVEIDCARYELSDVSAERDIFGDSADQGAACRANGGVVFLNRFDHLSHAVREAILRRIARQDVDAAPSGVAVPARFVLATARSLENGVVKTIARAVPIVVTLPRLADRSLEERTELAMHFLRVEGRRVASDIKISRGALRALVSVEFEDNVDGLRSCITNCCANAYLGRENDAIVIHTYNLPSAVLGLVESRSDDDQLVSGGKRIDDPFERVAALFQRVIDPVGSVSYGRYRLQRVFGQCVSCCSRIRRLHELRGPDCQPEGRFIREGHQFYCRRGQPRVWNRAHEENPQAHRSVSVRSSPVWYLDCGLASDACRRNLCNVGYPVEELAGCVPRCRLDRRQG